MNGPSHKEYAVPDQYRIVNAPEAPTPAPRKAAIKLNVPVGKVA